MKYLMALTVVAFMAGASEYECATMIEITQDGSFATDFAGNPQSTSSEEFQQDANLIWHYSVVSGFTQKVCPMGNDAGYVFTGGWYGGGKMFIGTTGDGTVYWETEPLLGDSLYWTNLATGTASAWTGDAYYLARTFDVWNDNGTPGSTGDDFPVSSDNTEVCLFGGDSSTPLWTWNGTGQFIAAAPDEPGKYACTPDGSYFAVGGYTGGHLAVAVFVPDSANPVLLWEEPSVNYSPRQLRITNDGSKVIFTVAGDMMRLDVASGILEDTYDLGASTDCFAISADGSYAAYGFTSVRLAQWNGSAYALAWIHSVSGYYAGSAAISDDGQTVYFGCYKNTYLSNRILRFDAASSTPLWTYDTPTGSGGNQDLVSWMDCSSDGSRLAVSSWGCERGGGDEVIVMDDTSPSEPYFSIDSPGSMWHVDISPCGNYITATGKHVHANVMGSGADVYMANVTETGLETNPGVASVSLSVIPNPSAGMAILSVNLPSAGTAEISVYDIAGHCVQPSVNLDLTSGNNTVPLSTELPSGLYVVRLHFGGAAFTERILVCR